MHEWMKFMATDIPSSNSHRNKCYYENVVDYRGYFRIFLHRSSQNVMVLETAEYLLGLRICTGQLMCTYNGDALSLIDKRYHGDRLRELDLGVTCSNLELSLGQAHHGNSFECISGLTTWSDMEFKNKYWRYLGGFWMSLFCARPSHGQTTSRYEMGVGWKLNNERMQK